MQRLLFRNVSLLADLSAGLARRMRKPIPTSFFWRAFHANRKIANAVVSTPYLQAMHTGTLSPIDYGCLMVQDSYYCSSAKDTLRMLLRRIDEKRYPDLRELVLSQIAAYEDYNQTFTDVWHIRDAEGVIPTETIAAYAAHERRVAHEEDPIYTIVALLPCYHLWPWLARQLKASPHYDPGIYRYWFDGVYEGESDSFGSSWLLGNFIEDWRQSGNPFDEGLAFDIYHTSIGFELKVFSEACSG